MEKPRRVVIPGIFISALVLWGRAPALPESVACARGGVEEAVPAGEDGSKSEWIPPWSDSVKKRGWRLGTCQSKAANALVGYYYYLPPSYETGGGKRYPVIYWLHGLGGSPASANPVVSRLDAGIKAGTAPETILISCTDPTRRSMWTDSKDGRIPVETVIVQDLIPHIDSTFRTIATRQGRAIEGYSMGGYGAAYLGFKYPGTFGVVSILAGALHSPDSLRARWRGIFDAVFGDDTAYADARSPWMLVQRSADDIRGATFIRIHVGADDGLREWNADFHDLLVKLRIEHTWSIIPNSTHNPAQFFANWPGNWFEFYAKAFAGATEPAAPEPGAKEFIYKQTPQGELKTRVHLPTLPLARTNDLLDGRIPRRQWLRPRQAHYGTPRRRTVDDEVRVIRELIPSQSIALRRTWMRHS